MKAKSIKFVRMTIQEANSKLLFQLYHLYGDRESANIADLAMENITGWQRIDRVVNKAVKLSKVQTEKLDEYVDALSRHVPVQYVLHEAWFCDMKFYVDGSVLIPRPETEELVHWIVEKKKASQSGLKILDIGTGSGCIAIALQKKLPDTSVYACDVSTAALTVAQKNAEGLNTPINLIEANILEPAQWTKFPAFDLIVSNPPYIPVREKTQMSANVVEHEPHLALFVNDDDPLLFYRAIREFAKEKLLKGGEIFLEVHEDLALPAAKIFDTNFELKTDMQGKNRMLRVY
jgi:release factor glutamine methyltransferase